MTFHIVWTNGNVIPINHDGCEERGETHEEHVQRLAENFPYFIYFDAQEAPMTETPARPLIDFSTEQRAKARDYASDADSRVLRPENREVLQAVANGEEVDAYALNRALLEAMSSASTRLGQSMARRELTAKIRHLGYIVQAVLDNHADNLPVYAEGDRSRQVQGLKSVVDSHQRHIETLNGEVAALSTAGAEALAQVEKTTAAYNALSERVTDLVAEKTTAEARLLDALDEIAALKATARYVTNTFLNADQHANADGYFKGQRDARKA